MKQGCSYVDHAGEKYNALTLVRYVGLNGSKYNDTWECKCDCGKLVVHRYSPVKRGVRRSCGCQNRVRQAKDYTGQRYGKLTLVRNLGKLDGRAIDVWECRCLCGKFTKATIGQLRYGSRCSCGCVNSERARRGLGGKGPTHSKWKGGRTKGNGYVHIWAPEHPAATSQGRVPEHRLVMEDSLGRPLTKDESVHHKNGIRDDNRIENLELWSRYHPHGSRAQDLIAYAEEILAKYAPEKLSENILK